MSTNPHDHWTQRDDHAHDRDTSALDRDRRAQARDQRATGRDDAADQHEQSYREHLETAVARIHDLRDQTTENLWSLETSEPHLDRRQLLSNTRAAVHDLVTDALTELARAYDQLDQAHRERRFAANDRRHSADDRASAAQDRFDSDSDRSQSAIDRELTDDHTGPVSQSAPHAQRVESARQRIAASKDLLDHTNGHSEPPIDPNPPARH